MHRSTHNQGVLRRAFTLVELLVVISIIAILAAIVLAVFGGVTETATRAKTTSTMNSFAAACDAFAMEHGHYPGVVPVRVLDDGKKLTSTQNVLLHLMGGCRVRTSDDDNDSPAAQAYDDYLLNANQPVEIQLVDPNNNSREWMIAVDLSRISEGPLINGKPYPPYFSPKSDELLSRWSIASNPNETDAAEQGYNQLPDLYDSWGNPIIYMAQQRKSGPLVEDPIVGPGGNSSPGQFSTKGLGLYFEAESLGDNRQSQKQVEMPSSALIGSRVTGPGGDGEAEEQRRWLTSIVAHPAFYDSNDDEWFGTSRGKYILWSPGPDGIYLSHQDGPLTGTGAYDPTWQNAEPEDIEEFDDVVMYGGG